MKNEEETFRIDKAQKREKEIEEVYVLKTIEVQPPPPPPPPRAPPDKSIKGTNKGAKPKSTFKTWRGHWPKPFKEVWRKKERIKEDPPPPECDGNEYGSSTTPAR